LRTRTTQGLQVERGLVGEEAWGGSLVLAFVCD